MSDLSITAANVKPGAGANIKSGTAGAAITAGQVVYFNSANKYVLSDNDGSGTRAVDGITLNGASADQPISVQGIKAGEITIGATLTPGTTYYLSGTPGGICPIADVTSGKDPIVIGVAKSATVLKLRAIDPDVTL